MWNVSEISCGTSLIVCQSIRGCDQSHALLQITTMRMCQISYFLRTVRWIAHIALVVWRVRKEHILQRWKPAILDNIHWNYKYLRMSQNYGKNNNKVYTMVLTGGEWKWTTYLPTKFCVFTFLCVCEHVL